MKEIQDRIGDLERIVKDHGIRLKKLEPTEEKKPEVKQVPKWDDK